ncbi:hypothetical protein O6H91_Y089900 [Diphasiastrum complanatum]|nr:hypothetical protein O6H91_Y089900 [Diphasiastrum complanatum]
MSWQEFEAVIDQPYRAVRGNLRQSSALQGCTWEFEAVIEQPYRAVRGLSYPGKVSEALTYIQNIPNNNQEIAKQYLDAGVMLSLIKILKSDSTEMKREAAWAVNNLASKPGLREASDAGAIDLVVVNMLKSKETVYPGVYCLKVLTSEVENRRKLKRCGSEAEKLLVGTGKPFNSRGFC